MAPVSHKGYGVQKYKEGMAEMLRQALVALNRLELVEEIELAVACDFDNLTLCWNLAKAK